MRKRLLTALLGLLGFTSPAQVTLRLTAVPAATPADATIYVAGSFNNWNPASATHALTRTAAGTYEITLPAGLTGTIEYKFTRGSWATVETTASHTDAPNRRHTFGAGAAPATVSQQVRGWQDSGPVTPAPHSTAAANVQLMAAAMVLPQLGGRTRRVWLYLPPDYAQTTRRYPVLYLQDGQNVFDATTAFAGEWGVDETLNQLAASRPATGCIVVAIDNGGAARLDEYSPWRNAKYGGGEGDQYLDFLVLTLKPYVDAHYRTAPGPASTGIGGSSMGALIATYAALKYPAVFGKVAAFSPAYWFAEKSLFDYLRQHPASPAARFYFVSGTTESETMVSLMRALRDRLQAGGVPAANLSFSTRPDGQHAEWFWRREFAAGYRWLYEPAATPAAASRYRGKPGRRNPYPPAQAARPAGPAAKK
ncbi:alpha/beta hydrolase-fold protein [uncultured Hymenobacter sp.]|uniref:alpha/beta hydrolase-fold protein n=1 Tax=uncultured Hymenobacter sp. TaxID=170016 RepID=UPI0035C9BBFE